MSALTDLKRGWELPASLTPVAVSNHALARFGERLRPGLDPDHLRTEFCHLLAAAKVTAKRPEWLESTQRASAYLLLGDGICCPLIFRDGELIAATCIMRNMLQGRRRQGRNASKARARSGRRAARKAAGNQGGRPPRPPDVSEWDPQ
jgi:hypothetical protein